MSGVPIDRSVRVVEIDGVRYVPANSAVANADAIRRALVSLWWGDMHRVSAKELGERCLSLKVDVGDGFDSGEGHTFDDVMAAIAEYTK